MVLVFTMADVRELRPERGRGAEGRVRERPLLSLIYILRIRSLLERREGGLVETPPCHIIRKLNVKASAKTCPRPRQRRHHRRRRPLRGLIRTAVRVLATGTF